MSIEELIEKWQEELIFSLEQEHYNWQNKEYLTALKHNMQKEFIIEFINDLKRLQK